MGMAAEPDRCPDNAYDPAIAPECSPERDRRGSLTSEDDSVGTIERQPRQICISCILEKAFYGNRCGEKERTHGCPATRVTIIRITVTHIVRTMNPGRVTLSLSALHAANGTCIVSIDNESTRTVRSLIITK
jgi:hypothetical protein